MADWSLKAAIFRTESSSLPSRWTRSGMLILSIVGELAGGSLPEGPRKCITIVGLSWTRSLEGRSFLRSLKFESSAPRRATIQGLFSEPWRCHPKHPSSSNSSGRRPTWRLFGESEAVVIAQVYRSMSLRIRRSIQFLDRLNCSNFVIFAFVFLGGSFLYKPVPRPFY